MKLIPAAFKHLGQFSSSSHYLRVKELPYFCFCFFFYSKGKSAVPPLFNGHKVLSFASDKENLFTENFSNNSNIGDSGISLPAFASRTNLELYNFSVIARLVKKVIINHDLAKVSGLDCIPVIVVKNCEPELSYILSWTLQYVSEGILLFILLEDPSCVLIFKNVVERSTTTTPQLVFFLWLVKYLNNLQITGLLITSRNVAFFWFSLWFQVFSVNCRSSDSCTW